MVLDSIYRVLEGGSVKRERKDVLLMHASISAVFSLSPFLPLFFFFFYSITQFFFLSFLWVLSLT